MHIRQLKHNHKKVQKEYKQIRKLILEDLDVSDKIERQAFMYLEHVNDLFDSIVLELEALDKNKANL